MLVVVGCFFLSYECCELCIGVLGEALSAFYKGRAT